MVWRIKKSEKIEWNGMGGMGGPNMGLVIFFVSLALRARHKYLY